MYVSLWTGKATIFMFLLDLFISLPIYPRNKKFALLCQRILMSNIYGACMYYPNFKRSCQDHVTRDMCICIIGSLWSWFWTNMYIFLWHASTPFSFDIFGYKKCYLTWWRYDFFFFFFNPALRVNGWGIWVLNAFIISC